MSYDKEFKFYIKVRKAIGLVAAGHLQKTHHCPTSAAHIQDFLRYITLGRPKPLP